MFGSQFFEFEIRESVKYEYPNLYILSSEWKWAVEYFFKKRRFFMKKGEHLVIVGCGGVGAPAAMLSRKLMPDVKITLIRAEDRFIVR